MYSCQRVAQRVVLWSQVGLQLIQLHHQPLTALTHWKRTETGFRFRFRFWFPILYSYSDCNFGSFPPAWRTLRCRDSFTIDQALNKLCRNCRSGGWFVWFPPGPMPGPGRTKSQHKSALLFRTNLEIASVPISVEVLMRPSGPWAGCIVCSGSEHIIASIMSKLISTLRLIAVKWVPDRGGEGDRDPSARLTGYEPNRLPGKDFHLPAPVSISCSHYALLPAAERDRSGPKERDGETHRDKDRCRRHLQIASGTGQKELLQFARIIALDRRGFDTVKINYVIVKADWRKKGVHRKKLS